MIHATLHAASEAIVSSDTATSVSAKEVTCGTLKRGVDMDCEQLQITGESDATDNVYRHGLSHR